MVTEHGGTNKHSRENDGSTGVSGLHTGCAISEDPVAKVAPEER